MFLKTWMLGAAVMFAACGHDEGSMGQAGQAQTEDNVTICHKTSSTSNPWVLMSVNEHALISHDKHGDVTCSGCTTVAECDQSAKVPPPPYQCSLYECSLACPCDS